MRHAMTANEKITLVLSALALVMSAIVGYCQFFYISERLTVAKVSCEFPTGGLRGDFAVRICVINNGNKDAVVFSCKPAVPDAYIRLRQEPKCPFILKPAEASILEYSGEVDITKKQDGSSKTSEEYTSGERAIVLDYQVVGARGYDRTNAKPIGRLFVARSEKLGIELSGWELLKLPVDLD